MAGKVDLHISKAAKPFHVSLVLRADTVEEHVAVVAILHEVLRKYPAQTDLG